MADLQLYNSFSDFEQPYIDLLCEQLIGDVLSGLKITTSLGIDPDRLLHYKTAMHERFHEPRND